MGLKPGFFDGPPSFPCAPELSWLQHWRLTPPEFFAFIIQDVHHATRPAILHSLHSVHMSRMKSLIGCKVVVRIEECMTVIPQA